MHSKLTCDRRHDSQNHALILFVESLNLQLFHSIQMIHSWEQTRKYHGLHVIISFREDAYVKLNSKITLYIYISQRKLIPYFRLSYITWMGCVYQYYSCSAWYVMVVNVSIRILSYVNTWEHDRLKWLEINVREHRRSNHEWTIQKTWQHMALAIVAAIAC